MSDVPNNRNEIASARDRNGRYLAGHASVGGRPKGISRRLRELYADDVPRLVGVLVKLGLGECVAGYEDIEPPARIAAAREALDRINGKAHQHIAVSEEPAQSLVNVSSLTIAQLEALALVELDEPEPDGPPGDIH